MHKVTPPALQSMLCAVLDKLGQTEFVDNATRELFQSELSFAANGPRLRKIVERVGCLTQYTIKLLQLLGNLEGMTPYRSLAGIPILQSENSKDVTRSYQTAGEEGVSLIILTKDASQHLDNLLSSFFKKNTYHPVELIIIDHASTDNTGAVIRTYNSKGIIQHIMRDRNYTFSESCNFGTNKAHYPYFLFLNNDIIYTSDALPKSVQTLKSNQSIGAVGIRLDDVVGSFSEGKEPGIQHLGIEFKWNEKRCYYQPEQIRHPSLKEYLYSSKDSSLFPAVTGAFLLVRKADFQKISGFDEVYNYGLEDMDLCLRLCRELGKKCCCINDMGLQHAEMSTRNKWNKETKSKIIERNHRIFKERWGGYVRLHILDCPPNVH